MKSVGIIIFQLFFLVLSLDNVFADSHRNPAWDVLIKNFNYQAGYSKSERKIIVKGLLEKRGTARIRAKFRIDLEYLRTFSSIQRFFQV